MSPSVDRARTGVGHEELAAIREAIDGAQTLDARRIDVVLRERSIALTGWVARAEDATIAVTIAQGCIETAIPIVDELQVDPHLREGADDLRVIEPALPPEGEILVGDTDMLAGTDTAVEEDVARAFQESEPWSPPDEPPLMPDPRDLGGGVIDDSRAIATAPAEPGAAAPDLTAADLSSGSLPSLSPDVAPPPGRDLPEAVSVQAEGYAPDDDTAASRMPSRVPGTAAGPGAVGEHTIQGGSIGSLAAAETGARGVDTQHADPARAAGGTAEGGGARRGPAAREDEALREEFPGAE